MDIEIREDEETATKISDPYDIVYSNIPDDTNMLKNKENCIYCNAKKFEYESEGLCCRKGQIRLANQETPPELMRLWTSNDSDARHFWNNIRFFNGLFSFTSLYCHLDSATTGMKKASIYTFRAHGHMYHNIQSFGNSR